MLCFISCRFEALKKWKELWNDEATYRKLIECFLRATKNEWAKYVCDLVPSVDAPPQTAPGKLCHLTYIFYDRFNLFVGHHPAPTQSHAQPIGMFTMTYVHTHVHTHTYTHVEL